MRQTAPKTPKRAAKAPPKAYVIGRSGFARISAVEGIRLTETMDADFREFERQGLSADERRKVIGRKYGKVR